MCGVYGALQPSKFEILDHVNRVRGNFASGVFYTNGKNYDWQKTQDCFDWNKIKLDESYIHLGHNQAPTSSERLWKEHNSHPFVKDNWIVAHNGVLTNFQELKKQYLPEHENIVDSSIIPALLHYFENKSGWSCSSQEKEQLIIKETLPLLEGTYGVWIANIKTLNMYIARQGSTLFYDDNSFSSVKGTNYEEVKEGTLYRFSKKGVTKVGEFACKSPFFTL